MKRLILLVLSLLAINCYNGNAQGPHNNKGKVIIAVNTSWRIGYFADENGKLLFNKQFDEVNIFYEGFAKVKSNGKYGFINTSGELVLPCKYDVMYDWFIEDLLGVVINEKFGFVNASGELVVPCIYDEISSYDEKWDFPGFYKGLCLVREGWTYKVINKDGKVIVPQCSEMTYWSVVK
jgi:hypothetical protein